MSLVNRTIRFDDFILKMAQDTGLDVNNICRTALAKAVNDKMLTHDVSRMNILTALRDGMIDADEAMKRLSGLDD